MPENIDYRQLLLDFHGYRGPLVQEMAYKRVMGLNSVQMLKFLETFEGQNHTGQGAAQFVLSWLEGYAADPGAWRAQMRRRWRLRDTQGWSYYGDDFGAYGGRKLATPTRALP